MNFLKKGLGLITMICSLSANAQPISKEEAINLLEPFKTKIMKVNEILGAQITMIGSYSRKVKTESGENVVCKFINGLRVTKLDSYEGKEKNLQEQYSFPINKFDKNCTKGFDQDQKLVRKIWITKGESLFGFEDFDKWFDKWFDNSTFDLSEIDGKQILTGKNEITKVRFNLIDFKVESLEIYPYSGEVISFSGIIYDHISIKNVDVKKIDITGVEVMRSLELDAETND